MIFVDRSTVEIPESLKGPRVKQAKEDIYELLSRPRAHKEQLRVKFHTRIYFGARESLIELFNGKCAYCESDISATGAVDVEHFRPKQRAEELDGTRDDLHYAWLAYDWDNLLIACPQCNRRSRVGDRLVGKANLFPVAGRRAQHPMSVDECRTKEKYLLLDPCYDLPEEHLEFLRTGLCKPLTKRGEVTIDVIGLNRPSLVDARRERWKSVEHTLQRYVSSIATEDPELLADSVRTLLEMMSGRQPYTAAARAAYQAYREREQDLGLPSRQDLEFSAAIPEEPVREEFRRASETPPEDEPIPEEILIPEPVTKVSAPPRRYKGRRELPEFAHQRIQRVEIHNFKAIEEVEFEFPEPPLGAEDDGQAVLLLGENATGKSTVLEAVTLALLGTEQIARLELDPADFIRRPHGWDAPIEDAEPAEVLIHFEDADSPVRLTIDPKSLRFEGSPEPATVLLAYGPRRFFPDRHRMRREHAPAGRVETLFNALAPIANPTSWLMHCTAARFKAAVRALREVLLLRDEALVSRPPRGQRAGAEIMFEVQGQKAPLRRLSEGYKTIVATSVDIMREMLEYWEDLETAKGVVLIDELENHLHPRWKMRIVSRLRRAMPKVQFIATTHDPLCLRGMNDGEVQVFDRGEEFGIEQLVDLPDVRGLSVEQLLTSEFFGLHSAEDPRVETEMARYATLATRRDRSPAEELELREHQQRMQSTIALGTLPEEQLMHEAFDQYLEKRRDAPASDRPELKKAVIDEVLGLWDSLDPEELVE